MRLLILFTFLMLLNQSTAQTPSLKENAKEYLLTLHKPASVGEYNAPFHFPPQNQDTTNACWSFATLSSNNASTIKGIKLTGMKGFSNFGLKIKIYGITNIMAVQACSKLDEIDELITAWGVDVDIKAGRKPKYFVKPEKLAKKLNLQVGELGTILS